jgi:hypothetical protein
MRTGVPVVNETLEGRAGYLKAFTIAVGVLDATPQIDAAHLFEDIGLRSFLPYGPVPASCSPWALAIGRCF